MAFALQPWPGMTMRVLFSDGDDRVSAAIARLASDGTTAVLLDAPDRAGLASRLAARRGAEPALADKLLDRPLYAALAMLAEGEADAVVTGAESHTGDVMRACELCLGRGDPARLASSSFVMDVPGRGKLVFSDCAVNPEPTVDQLATIAIAAGDAASALLGVAPRVALLSFSTHGSAHHERAARVARATELARVRRPAMAIDGELQVDAALD
ncbi:MAG TPA: phosphate acyltransferase, partial [Kofleriaceae bacterium]|nr:phosphate acyltransferase [Kofleriaceae bacterium]